MPTTTGEGPGYTETRMINGSQAGCIDTIEAAATAAGGHKGT
jgi:hypothetical protein